jgi:alpha-beta hydrolase superfamily lysophospholipase
MGKFDQELDDQKLLGFDELQNKMVSRHHFVLVHGLMHGAWCWYKTVDLLRRTGHRVTTLDLASCGTHPADPNTISEFAVYNQPLVDLLLSLPETDKVGLVSGRRAPDSAALLACHLFLAS